jgi:hypothetical protein
MLISNTSVVVAAKVAAVAMIDGPPGTNCAAVAPVVLEYVISAILFLGIGAS